MSGSVKKSRRKGDLPGQKVMKHGPKKVPEIEKAAARYADAEARLEAAKEALKTAEGAVFDTLKKKRTRTYTCAGRVFARVSNGEKLSVTKAKAS